LISNTVSVFEYITALKGKAIPAEAWTDPEGSTRLRPPDFKNKSAHEGGKFVSPMYWPPLPSSKYFWYSFLLETESTPGQHCGRQNYVNEKFQ